MKADEILTEIKFKENMRALIKKEGFEVGLVLLADMIKSAHFLLEVLDEGIKRRYGKTDREM